MLTRSSWSTAVQKQLIVVSVIKKRKDINHTHRSHFCSILLETTAVDAIQAALRIRSQDLVRGDGPEGVDTALDVLRMAPMTKDDRLKKARRISSRLAKGRDPQMSERNKASVGR